jgi:hypothetical protein
VTVEGTGSGDVISVTGSGTSAQVVGLSAVVTLTHAESANDVLVISGRGGNDQIIATALPAGVLRLTLDGGAGEDLILGSQGADTLIGGTENDSVFGDNGNDTAFLGSGDDVFQWDPGDGNDTIEGEAGTDKLLFFGSIAAESINIAASGGRVLFTRDVGTVTMDLDDVEQIEFRALGAADNIVVGDLSGTDVTQVALDLRGPGGSGDGAVDTVTVNATNGADGFIVVGGVGGVQVTGLSAAVSLLFQEAANDRLILNGLGGDDVIDASFLAADGIQLTLNGGLGEDALIGGDGDDLVNGGDGDDHASMGAGNDTFVWNPGDDNDTIEGGTGTLDTLEFNGSAAAETIAITANAGRALLTRNIANVVMDLNDVERITFNALGGTDAITVNDLTGTDVTQVNLDLAGSGGSTGDGAADTVTVEGTGGADVIGVTGSGSSADVSGLSAVVTLIHAEGANDVLVVNAGGGDDQIAAASLFPGMFQLTLEGGAGEDDLLGSSGADVLAGGLDADRLEGGGGDDRFIYRIGDGADEIVGFVAGAGTDDRVALGSMPQIESFDDVLALATQVGADTVIDFGNGDVLTLRGVVRANLRADDFLIGSPNDPPVNTLPASIEVEANVATAIAGLSIADIDAGSSSVTTTLTVQHGTLTASGGGVSGSGTASVTITGTLSQVNAALATVGYTGDQDFFGSDSLAMTTNDGGNSGTGGAQSDTDQVTIAVGPIETGDGGNNGFNAPAGNARIDGLGGVDTVTFDFALVQASVAYVGNTIVIDGPSSHTVLTGIERFVFTDGTVDNADGSPLIDDLFYNSRNHDVWNAQVDPDFHFNAIGWTEGRDPSAFFDTSIYLTANPDVASGGLNPLTHFHTVGWKEFRVPSLEFGTRQYLDANPDVRAAQIDPLFHFLGAGASEGRLPVAPSELVAANGFDFVHYLANNPDVAAAGVDPFFHFQTTGWKEGRNPNALFDTSGYLAVHTDVAAAHINPLDHYNVSGWREGRDPSAGFDTTSYLAANPDVAAANINPLMHFLAFGVHEGRSPHADGVLG